MLLIVSHFTENLGTTDFFINYLKENHVPFYYLRHPFNYSGLNYTELISFNGNKTRTIRKYKKSGVQIFDFMRNFRVSLFTSLRLNNKIDKVIGFGSFNVIPFILTNLLLKRKIIFWGVDYSRKRFKNNFLNSIYLLSETIACKNSDLVIHPTRTQEEVRIRSHHLTKSKSLVSPNGVEKSDLPKKRFSSKKVDFIYVGSISEQHGIIDFVDHFYHKNNMENNLFIFGGGEKGELLKQLIEQYNLGSKVFYMGCKNKDEILRFVQDSKSRLVGIAPYKNVKGSHVIYGDSLKIKEYLNMGLFFISSNVVKIEKELIEYGFVYQDYTELDKFIKTIDTKELLTDERLKVLKNSTLKKYYWGNIFSHLIEILTNKEIENGK